MQVKKSSRILKIFINGREYAEKILVCTEISQFMNILELNVKHLETLNDLFSITICKNKGLKTTYLLR